MFATSREVVVRNLLAVNSREGTKHQGICCEFPNDLLAVNSFAAFTQQA